MGWQKHETMVIALLLVSYSSERRSQSTPVAVWWGLGCSTSSRKAPQGEVTPQTLHDLSTPAGTSSQMSLTTTAKSTRLWIKSQEQLREHYCEGDRKEVLKRQHRPTAVGPGHESSTVILTGLSIATNESQQLETCKQTWGSWDLLQLSGLCPCQGWIPT